MNPYPESTFKYQDQIQKLPIPDLEASCNKYLEVLEPLQNEKEHAQTVKAVKKFLNSKISKHLDSQLREYAKYRPSYIEEFWYDSYLNYDSPVVLNLNPFFLIEDDPNPVRPSQIKRAAAITISALRFVRALRKNELPPDKVKGKPLDMYQYTKLFASARIPTPSGCVMQSDPNSSHIVVLSRSQFYWFNVLDKKNDLILTENDLKLNFKEIIHDSYRASISDLAKSSFGLLTTENRRVWASIRSNLSNEKDDSQATNNEILKIIDSALFVVCLDDVEVESLEEISTNMLCGISKIDNGVQTGTCTNRWYDKLQIIVTKNSKVGVNFEHTGVDGHTVLRFVSDIYTDSILRFAKSINQNAPSIWITQSPDPLKRNPEELKEYVTTPRKLEWDLTPDLSLSLRFAETRLSDLISQTEFAVLEFKGYGSDQIKKFGCSPDAFVQMSFQAAYYALYGRVECTYEPAMTKQFLHGRTEAIRTVSNESNLFVRKFFENIPAQEKFDLLKKACLKHTQRTRESSSGLGVDRYLYALFCIWQKYVASNNNEDDDEEDFNDGDSEKTLYNSSHGKTSEIGDLDDLPRELPSIFANSGWDKLNSSVLSTSNCGNPALRLFGFGPTASNGFGFAYIIKSDSVTIAACSKHRQTRRVINALNSYYVEVENLYQEINAPKINVNLPSISSLTSTANDLSEHVRDKLAHLHWPVGTSDSNGINGGNAVNRTDTEKAGQYASTRNSSSNEEGATADIAQQLRGKVFNKTDSKALNYLLGGYGYFDVGEDEIKSRGTSPEPPYRETKNKLFSNRDIVKKLRLAEY